MDRNEILSDLFAIIGEAPDSIQHVGADQGRDGKFHVFASAHLGEQARLVHGSRAATGGAKWTFKALPSLEHSELYDLKVDSRGGIHVVFRNTVLPCDPDCNVDVK
jgi:hypothetical protein